MAVVCNSSPLIALSQIGQLELLHTLFQEVLIPPAVAKEAAGSLGAHPWIRVQPLAGPPLRETTSASLGRGEREALNLAVDVKAKVLILDDEPARRIARQLGLPVMGTAGVLILAKERKLIPAVRPLLDALLAERFFLSQEVYDLVLFRAEEL